MASGNTGEGATQPGQATSGNTAKADAGAPLLSVERTAALAGYQRALAGAPLSAGSRAKYVARVRGFLAWLDTTDYDPEVDGDPLTEPAARDGRYDQELWMRDLILGAAYLPR